MKFLLLMVACATDSTAGTPGDQAADGMPGWQRFGPPRRTESDKVAPWPLLPTS